MFTVDNINYRKINLEFLSNSSSESFDIFYKTNSLGKVKFVKFASQPENQRVFAGEIPYGPTHLKGINGIDAKIAADLPTAPQNLKGALASNTEFWVENGEDLEQRFNAWAAR